MEEVVQLAHLHLNNAMQDIQQQMDERFGMAAEDLSRQMGQIHTRFDTERQISYSKHESIMFILTKLTSQMEHPNSVSA